jgi:hypothetical protein
VTLLPSVSPRKSTGAGSKVRGGDGHPRVLVVGSGTRFLSAISYFTIRESSDYRHSGLAERPDPRRQCLSPRSQPS